LVAVEQVLSFMVLGVRVHLVKMSQVLSIIESWVDQGGGCRYIVATQMHGIMEARRDPSFKEILNSADLFVPDGFSLTISARLRRMNLKKRVPGPDLCLEGCRLAAERGYRVFFYGDTDETLAALVSTLKDRFPNLQIAGVHSPPFRPLTEEEDAQETEMINDSGADIVWVGLGLPKQERWMFEHREKLNATVLVGVGAAFKFMSGQVRRAPPWVGDHGFEWLWRFFQEPHRVWRRVMIDGPHFLICVALEALDSRKRGDTQ
jgi:N-acetylglucosaminyldiphosphoundecaprenol N-acetyl-beta-D-mannosaminyltransferase